MKAKKKKLLLYFGLLAICFAIIKNKFLSLPLHNDELNHLQGVRMIIKNNFNPFIEWWSYHPPLIYTSVALINNLTQLNNQIIVPRMIVGAFGFAALVATYFLGKELYNNKVGLLASFLLFFLPIFQSQTSLFYLAIPLTFFFTISFYYYFKKKWWHYLFFASCLVLTKETGAMIIALLTLFTAFINLINTRVCLKKTIKNSLIIGFPLVLFAVWLLLNKHFLGWYLWPYNSGYLFSNRSYGHNISDYIHILEDSFTATGTWVLTFGLLSGINIAIWNKKARKKIFHNNKILFIFFVTLFSCGVFFFSAYLPRYLLFVWPFLLVILAAFIHLAWQVNSKLTNILLFALLITLASNWFHFSNKPIYWAGETNYAYTNIIKHQQQVVHYIDKTLIKDSIIMTEHPFALTLIWSPAGYVQINDKYRITKLDPTNYFDFSGYIIVSDLNRYEQSCDDINLFNQSQIIKTINSKGFKTKIYEIH